MSDEPTQPTDDSAARHERVKDIFALTLGLPESEQAALLKSECKGDDVLRAEVESLLAHATEASTLSALEPPTAPRTDPLIGSTIGHYHIKHTIGTGGMGTVYQAMQEQPRRVVALKVMKRGIASKSALRRFEYESQILARLRHPGIAQIYEAGTHEDESGESVPFFAMEYIPAAMPITRYAEQKKLGTRERLDLFARVCDAVQHGHGKGIIHRDLKPSNILVDSSGQPKIIDFGVARSTDSDLAVTTLQTDIGQLIGTLQYMSPEQCLADPIDLDTRSDVYALGVVLYELLCSKPPYDVSRAAVFEATRMIQEATPARPSTISKALRGDVETVVMKALEKDRERRYRSAVELGEDLRHYLNNEPISAQPPSLGYQVRMFAKKNRTVFRAGVAVILALLIGLGSALGGMAWAMAERYRADIKSTEALAAKQGEADARARADAKAEEAEAALSRIEYNSYLANVQMAGAWLGLREFERLRERLDTCPPDLRGWEWHRVDAASNNSLAELHGHTGWVNSASFSPDGTRIVTASIDKTARVWDATTGESVVELKEHTGWVYSASFSPDGTRIVTASGDRTARVWDAPTGKPVAQLWGHTDRVLSASFSPDGARIATVSADGIARVWEAATGKCVAELEGDERCINSAAFSPDGTRVVTASSDGTAFIWSVETGESVSEFGLGLFTSRTARGLPPSAGPSFSPDGNRIVTATDEGTVCVWNAATGEPVTELKGHTGSITSASFSPDGTRIVTASEDATARLWDATTGDSVAELRGHTGSINYASFSPDGTHIATASHDGTAHVWDATTGDSVAELRGHTGSVNSASFSLDNMQIVTSSVDGTARLWDPQSPDSTTQLQGDTGPVHAASFSPDGAHIVTRLDWKTARVWDLLTGESVTELKIRRAGPVSQFVFSPDGTRIATVSVFPNVVPRLWDAVTGQLLTELQGPTGAVESAVFSPDGARIVVALQFGTSSDREDGSSTFVPSDKGRARVYDAATGEPLADFEGHTGLVRSALFSPDGTRIVTASSDGTARIWDAATGTPVAELRGHTDWVLSASFSPDGLRVLTASRDGTARLWDAATGETVAVCRGNARSVVFASFSPDGSRIVMDGRRVQIRDATTGTLVTELAESTDLVQSASFSPDGTRIVTASLDGTVGMWDVATGHLVVELRGQAGSMDFAAFSPDGTRLVTVPSDGPARVWDAIPYRLRFMQRMAQGAEGEAAVGVVDHAFDRMEDWTQVADFIREHVDFSSEERRRALAIVAVRAETERAPLRYARRLAEAHQWQIAATAFADVMETQPDNAEAVLGYGYCLAMSGDYPAAIKAYERATAFAAARGHALYNLGCVYALTGDDERAFDALEASLEAGAELSAYLLRTDPDLDSLRTNPRFEQFAREAGRARP